MRRHVYRERAGRVAPGVIAPVRTEIPPAIFVHVFRMLVETIIIRVGRGNSVRH